MAAATVITVSCIFIISICGFVESKPNNSGKSEIGCSNSTEKLQYQISLQLAEQPKSEHSTGTMKMKHFCGGSLIKPNAVLTSAHCTDNEHEKHLKDGLVYAVTGTKSLTAESKSVLKSLVIAAYRLRRYYGTNTADIAVLKLKNPAPVDSGNIALIPLRTFHEIPEETCLASGWSLTESVEANPYSYLLASSVRIVHNPDCVRKYNELNVHIFEDNVCAGIEARGDAAPCQGDPGDPLVCDGQLAGLVSKGYSRTQPSFPGVYMSIFYHNEWIQDMLNMIESDNLTESDHVVVLKIGSNSSTIKPGFIVILACLVLRYLLC